MKNEYEIRYLPSFEKELITILEYITYDLKNKNAAERLLVKIENAVNKRKLNPKCYEIYKSKKERKYVWYRIYVDNYTIFYTLRENTMEIAHLIYSKRNIEELV